MAVIFALSAVPGKSINSAGLGNDSYHVTGHFIMYFILYFTYYKATKNLGLSLVLTLVYSITDELHQRYTPGRASSVKDIYTDNLAGLIAGGIIWKLYPKLPRILKTWLEA